MYEKMMTNDLMHPLKINWLAVQYARPRQLAGHVPFASVCASLAPPSGRDLHRRCSCWSR